MSISFEQAKEILPRATEELFTTNPRIQSVGIMRDGEDFLFSAVEHTQMIVALEGSQRHSATRKQERILGIPVKYDFSGQEVESLPRKKQISEPVDPLLPPEASLQRPIICGIQIQNYDQNRRAGLTQQQEFRVGTLGCIVHLEDGRPAILSNKHVLAAGEKIRRGKDRIFNPGGFKLNKNHFIASLNHYEPLVKTSFKRRNGPPVFENEIDAAVAVIAEGIVWQQTFHSSRIINPPAGVSTPELGLRVFKVGQTSGLTEGEVVAIAVSVGPIRYSDGYYSFRDVIRIRGNGNRPFAEGGDSGSIVLSESGEVIGMIFAGDGQNTYACPMEKVLNKLKCTLA